MSTSSAAAPAVPRSIVVAAGADAVRELLVGADQRVAEVEGINDSRRLLEAAGLEFASFHVTPNFLKKKRGFALHRYRTLLNVICDPDINPKVLEVLARILQGSPIRVINHPDAVRTAARDRMARCLAGTEGLVVPKTLRIGGRNRKRVPELIASAGLRLPLILRPAGAHGGHDTRITATIDGAVAFVASHKDAYLTEFHDYRSTDGYYRKYRCFVIGEDLVFRHLVVSDRWLVHARDRARVMFQHPAMLAEEKRLHDAGAGGFTPTQRAALGRIRERSGLDYLGVDFTILESGELLLFEANPAMNFFPVLVDDRMPYNQRCLPRAVAALRRLLGEPAVGSAAAPARQSQRHQ